MVRGSKQVNAMYGYSIWIPRKIRKPARASVLDALQGLALLNGPEGFFVVEMCDSALEAPKSWHSGR